MSTITANPAIFSVPFLLIVLGIGLLLVWVAEKSPAARFLHRNAGVVAPFSNLLALLFGLFVAFLANDIFIHAEHARASIAREADAVRVILNISDGLGERGRTLRQQVADLGKVSTGEDWRSEQQIAAADAQSLKMLREVMFGELAATDVFVRHAIEAEIKDIRGARRERIAVAHSRTSALKWIAAFILGVLTQMAVVVVHLGKPRPAILSVTLFGFGMAFILWIVLERHDPFEGAYPVTLEPVRAAYQLPP